MNHRGTVFDSDALALLQRLYGHSTTGIKLMSRMELEGNVEVGVSNLINIDERYYTYKDGRFVLLGHSLLLAFKSFSKKTKSANIRLSLKSKSTQY